MAKKDEKKKNPFEDPGTDYDPEPIYLDDQASDDSDAPMLLDELAPPKVSQEKLWYVVHCYSGYEKKVCQAIEQRISYLRQSGGPAITLSIQDLSPGTEVKIRIQDE